jgi:hypothetical protein
MYLPLALLIAMALEARRVGQAIPSRLVAGSYAAGGLILAASMGLAPWAFEAWLRREGLAFAYAPPAAAWTLAFAIGALALAGAWALRRNRMALAVAAGALLSFLTVQTIWRLHFPPYLQLTQAPLVEWVNESEAKGGDIAFYRVVSFAALFYGDRPITFLHSSKFRGDPAILDRRGPRDLYVAAPRNQAARLRREHPLVEPVEQRGLYELGIVRKE